MCCYSWKPLRDLVSPSRQAPHWLVARYSIPSRMDATQPLTWRTLLLIVTDFLYHLPCACFLYSSPLPPIRNIELCPISSDPFHHCLLRFSNMYNSGRLPPIRSLLSMPELKVPKYKQGQYVTYRYLGSTVNSPGSSQLI